MFITLHLNDSRETPKDFKPRDIESLEDGPVSGSVVYTPYGTFYVTETREQIKDMVMGRD